MNGGYRIWPAVVVAVLGLTGATAVAVGAGTSDATTGCPAGQDWVAVTPLSVPVDGEDAVMAEYRQRMDVLFTACLDVDDLPSLDPDPRS